jgi:hypothetical protein
MSRRMLQLTRPYVLREKIEEGKKRIKAKLLLLDLGIFQLY